VKLPNKDSRLRNAPASLFPRLRAVLVLAGLLGASASVGVLTVSGHPTYDNGDYYGENYDNSGNTYPDQQELNDPYDDYYHSRLQRHGEWISVQGYGNVWRPSVVASWSPYTLGYWASSERGWMWVSYEPFGDIVYHYGNWGRLDRYGWCWFPGREWAPNHVTWTDWQDSIGWYPTPPSLSIQIGLDLGSNYDRYIWVSHRNFLNRDFSRYRERNPSRLWRGAGPPRDGAGRVDSLSTSVVERWTGKRVTTVQTQEIQRRTTRGEVKIVVPDQPTREHVHNKGAKISRRWLAPKAKGQVQVQGKVQDKGKAQDKGKDQDKGKAQVQDKGKDQDKGRGQGKSNR